MSNRITSETPLPRPIPASDELGPLVGRTFGGYEITSYIGEGPTGAVYRAEDLVGQKMAVKVMHRELSRKEAADKLWADLQKLSSLGLPQLVKVYDSGFDAEGQFYYTTDELPGTDLEAGLAESGALAPSKALEIVRQICVALEAAHAVGVVHGGLKPRNVFLQPGTKGLTVKVLDFGAAHLAGGLDKGVIVGNPFYMAPEQFGGQADPLTDVYALGVLMYELFSGTLPFQGPSHGQVMMRHLAEVPQPPPGCDEELSKIILRALIKTPAGRYGSIKSLAVALDRWAQGMPAMLTDAAGFQVAARAAESRKMKQAALSAPDATTPMPKLELSELARGSRPEPKPKLGDGVRPQLPPTPSVPSLSQKVVSSMGEKNMKKNGAENPNSSESVEASLEDFINQANASFPATSSDGWDLHTGDVELVDEAEDQLESEEHVAAPASVKREKTPLPAKAKQATPSKPIKVKDPTPTPRPATKTTKGFPVAAPAALAPEPPAPVSTIEENEEPEPLDPPPSAPRFKVERTEVVSSPLGAGVPWTANPLVVIGGLLAAFVIGAGLVVLMVRTLMPAPQAPQTVVQQPIVQPAPAPVAQPVQAAPAQPVVTPLPTQPVVTPLPTQPVAAQPIAQPVAQPIAQPVVAQPIAQPVVAQPVAAQPVAAAPQPARAPKRRPAAAAPRPAPAAKPVARKAAPAASDDDDAPAPKKPAKKEAKGGGDWVDPFAQ